MHEVKIGVFLSLAKVTIFISLNDALWTTEELYCDAVYRLSVYKRSAKVICSIKKNTKELRTN
jgi:hypothetical protein